MLRGKKYGKININCQSEWMVQVEVKKVGGLIENVVENN